MIDFEKFGCQAPFQECDMAKQYEEMHKRSGMEEFNIPATEIMRICLNAQQRLRELAAFKDKTYPELLRKYSEGESGNCPMYVIGCEESVDFPTLLI